MELLCDGQRAVTADADQAAQSQLLDRRLCPASSSGGTSIRFEMPALAVKRSLFVEPRIVPPWWRMPLVFLRFSGL